MGVLTSQLERDETFTRRSERMEALVAELRERTALVARGGGERAVERHRSRGKLTARERIDRLVDPGSAFLELNALAAWDLYDGAAPSAGIVTGIGVVDGQECVVVANDATVKAATGQEVSAEELGGADVHTRRSGVADHFASSDEHALALARQIVRQLHRRKETPWDVAPAEPPA